ncbi:hypothetical protein [Leucobacter luti]|uniref:hypothetical protein n=1 Tax=Leucobacter luti TaxID=340320 RepID=UPI00215D94EC|nr:hypothetical protein [Leucobacter luti]
MTAPGSPHTGALELPTVDGERIELPHVLDYEADPAQLPRSSARRTALLFFFLGAGLVVATLVAAALGQMQIPIVEVIGALCRRAGIACGADASHVNTDAALWEVRFPVSPSRSWWARRSLRPARSCRACSETRSRTPAWSASPPVLRSARAS